MAATTEGRGRLRWELSADSANPVRRIFLTSDVQNDRFRRVAGLADRDPFMPDEPRHPSNRRISVVLAYNEAPSAEEVSGGGEAEVHENGSRSDDGELPETLNPYNDGTQHEKFDDGQWQRPQGFQPDDMGDKLTLDELKRMQPDQDATPSQEKAPAASGGH